MGRFSFQNPFKKVLAEIDTMLELIVEELVEPQKVFGILKVFGVSLG